MTTDTEPRRFVAYKLIAGQRWYYRATTPEGREVSTLNKSEAMRLNDTKDVRASWKANGYRCLGLTA